MTIIESNPDKACNWNYVSSNRNITMDTIEKYSDKAWNWDFISQNPCITMDIIENHMDKPWNWKFISQNSMKRGKELWIKNKIKNAVVKRVIIYKILCNIFENDICELIVNNII